MTPNCFCSCVFPLQNIRSCRSFTGFEDSCQSLFTDKKTKKGSPAPLGTKNLTLAVFCGRVFFPVSVHRLISYLVLPPSPVGLAPLGQKSHRLDVLYLHSSISNRVRNIHHMTHFSCKQKGNLDERNPQACVLGMCDLVKEAKQEPDVPADVPADVAEDGLLT